MCTSPGNAAAKMANFPSVRVLDSELYSQKLDMGARKP